MKIKLLILATAVLGFANALPAAAQIFSTTPIVRSWIWHAGLRLQDRQRG